jgi:hypothetical protein
MTIKEKMLETPDNPTEAACKRSMPSSLCQIILCECDPPKEVPKKDLDFERDLDFPNCAPERYNPSKY